MSTVITHVYNEEFLLPYWLSHHKEIFEHGIVIDFNSTDNSIRIFKEIVPNWKILKSPLEEFDAEKLDRYVENIEKDLIGPRIALTITEFFIGDPSLVRGQMIVPQVSLISQQHDEPFHSNIPIHKQRHWGLVASVENVTASTHKFPKGNGRSIHDHDIRYPIGRHFIPTLPSPFLIIRVNDCFFSDEMFTRRLQIQRKIPKSDVIKNYGVEHTNFGRGLTKEDLLNRQEKQRADSVCLKHIIETAIKRQEFTAFGKYKTSKPEEILDMWMQAANNFHYTTVPTVYTAGGSFWDEISFLRNSYESILVFRIYKVFRNILKKINWR